MSLFHRRKSYYWNFEMTLWMRWEFNTMEHMNVQCQISWFHTKSIKLKPIFFLYRENCTCTLCLSLKFQQKTNNTLLGLHTHTISDVSYQISCNLTNLLQIHTFHLLFWNTTIISESHYMPIIINILCVYCVIW